MKNYEDVEECKAAIKSFARTKESEAYLLSIFGCNMVLGNTPKEALDKVALHYLNLILKITEKYESERIR